MPHSHTPQRRDLVVIGASAGGVEAVRDVVANLPAKLPAAVLIVIHVTPSAKSMLPQILERSGKLPAAHVKDGDELEAGRIYIAPPDHHFFVQGGRRARLSHGPRVNRHRPAIDPLFISAAQCGRRTIGVILSGVLDDGTSGMLAVKIAGGVTVAQDPNEAVHGAMPANAIEQVGVDHVLTAKEIGVLLGKLAGSEVPDGNGNVATLEAMSSEANANMELELEGTEEEQASLKGPASGFTCPDCHGALWELSPDQKLLRYRCRIGHSYGAESLFAAQSEKLEDAMWGAYRALEEVASLAKRMAKNATARGKTSLAKRYEARYVDAIERARTLHAILERGQLDADAADADSATTRVVSAAKRSNG